MFIFYFCFVFYDEKIVKFNPIPFFKFSNYFLHTAYSFLLLLFIYLSQMFLFFFYFIILLWNANNTIHISVTRSYASKICYTTHSLACLSFDHLTLDLLRSGPSRRCWGRTCDLLTGAAWCPIEIRSFLARLNWSGWIDPYSFGCRAASGGRWRTRLCSPLLWYASR